MKLNKSLAIKDQRLEKRHFFHRVIEAGVLILLLLGVVIARLFYLQIIDQEHYTTLSSDNRVKIIPISPPRGLIYDRNGLLLAENLPSFDLEITPENIDHLSETIDSLAKIIDITPEDRDRFYKLKNQRPAFEGIPIRTHLTEEEVARFAVNRFWFSGVEINARQTRHYPMGAVGVHALGYVGRIDEKDLRNLDSSNYSGTSHIGKQGLEKAYENLLHGKTGYKQVEINAQGRVIRTLEVTDPIPGADLHLSIDIKIQEAAEKSFGEEIGSIIAIEPETGDLIVFVSQPTFDPNLFVNGISSKAYKELSNDINRPLYNRALFGQYPPGSTMKPFIGLAGLEYGVMQAHDTTWCPGYFTLPGNKHKYRDWKTWGHGNMNLHDAIVQSCDVYFYDLAQALGIDRLHDYLGQFGFGQKSGIDILGEKSGLMPSREWKKARYNQAWYPGETIITGIGQGYTLTTPLQLASAAATLSHKGVRVQPRLVKAIRHWDTGKMEVLAPIHPPAIPIINPKDWDDVTQYMRDVIHSARGTAKGIVEGLTYDIGGKTGTAQVFTIKQNEKYNENLIDKKLRDHALFIAFAPVSKAKVAMSVIVENGGHGGSVAAPMARAVMDAYLVDGGH